MITTTRVHRWWLGALGPVTAVGEESASSSEVQLHPAARRALRRQLQAPGHLRGGLLFGQVQEDALHVTQVAPAGYRWWQPDPLCGDERYALGWMDALAACTPGDIDWVGSWLAAPDSRPFSVAQGDRWVRRAAGMGVVDSLHPLVTVGWSEGRLDAVACRVVDGATHLLPVVFTP
ncbi:hypothetical protein [Deinococcus enclensis]|uniref:Uncharacterized protein n=1 Tax=Deinococcus enclensis TaxID=1049582 RepID=A0ABT9MH76_9DEIO|nr:hypothetical protein [Deinococcus enclensis]MDP9765569.1 hypothetical protein [Deinococcus enclensis]